MVHVPRPTPTPAPSPPNALAPSPPSAAPPLSSSSSSCASCFHCVCTVCGQRLHEVPTVTCSACGSLTHITCAKDVYSGEWILTGVVGATSGGNGTSAGGNASASPTAPVVATAATAATAATIGPCPGIVGGFGAAVSASACAAVPSVAPFPPDPVGTSSGAAPGPASPPLSMNRDASSACLSPSSQVLSSAAARIDKKYNYYCHPDCAMGMEVVYNPQFDAALSARIEAAFTEDWQTTLRMVTERLGLDNREEEGRGDAVAAAAAGFKRKRKGEKVPTAATTTGATQAEEGGISAQLNALAAGNAVVARELNRLYSQLRAEVWASYFEQERHHSGHPLFHPPPFLDLQREAANAHVLEAATPQGQAARLYLLDPAKHPVGSAVAIPIGVLSRWQQPALTPVIKVNDSNNFVAESALAVMNEAVVPETVVVYRNCSKEGRVIAS